MDQADLDQCRALLDRALVLTTNGGDLDQIAGSGLQGVEISDVLAPAAAAAAVVSWLVTNGQRVDAIVEADDMAWRVVFGSNDRHHIDWIDVIVRPARFEGIRGGRVVVLNGPSGAGKSTIMHALQAAADVPWVLFDEPENMGAVEPGYLIWRDRAPGLHAGYLAAIASLAQAGNYVAVSAAGHGQATLRACFAVTPTLWVGLSCDRATLLRRERRPDRWGGIVDDSLGIHEDWTYDLTLDTTGSPDPARHAAEIIRAIGS